MLILSCIIWEIDRKSFDKNEVENLTNFVEIRLFKVFLKLLDMNYVFQSNVTCDLMWFYHHAMCDFPVIT